MVVTMYLSNSQSSPNYKFGLEQKNVESQIPNDNQTVIQVQAASTNHRYVT